MNGLFCPNEGVVIVDNIVTSKSGSQIWEIRNQVGIVFQNPDNQIIANTLEDDVAFGLENNGVSAKEIRIRVDQALNNVQLFSERMKDPKHLSGGQKQKVAIASILAMKPKVLILDEAISMLDPKGKKDVLMLCKELSEKEKISVINITNNLQESFISDRIVVLNDGEVLLDDKPIKVFEKRDLLSAIGLEVPIIVELAHRLRNKGYLIDKKISSEEEFIKNLWTLF